MKALGLLVGAGVLALAASQADATVTLYLQNSGANGGALTQVSQGSSSLAYGSNYGTFSNVSVIADGTIQPSFKTSSIDTTSSSGGTLTLYVVNSGLSNLSQALTSTFTANGDPSISSLIETTYISLSAFNAANPMAGLTQIGQATFDSTHPLGSSASPTTYNGSIAGSFSEITKYVITASGAGSANSTINITAGAVPEPASWALMLVGFGLIGATLRQRRPARVSFG